jgi:hypothetical protein
MQTADDLGLFSWDVTLATFELLVVPLACPKGACVLNASNPAIDLVVSRC